MKNPEVQEQPALILPEPEIVPVIRPILVEAMTQFEPGTPNFELAAFLHDQLEEYLSKQEVREFEH